MDRIVDRAANSQGFIISFFKNIYILDSVRRRYFCLLRIGRRFFPVNRIDRMYVVMRLFAQCREIPHLETELKIVQRLHEKGHCIFLYIS